MKTMKWDFLKSRRENMRAGWIDNNRKLAALDLAVWSPPRRASQALTLPRVHSKEKKPPRKNLIGELLCEASILNKGGPNGRSLKIRIERRKKEKERRAYQVTFPFQSLFQNKCFPNCPTTFLDF